MSSGQVDVEGKTDNEVVVEILRYMKGTLNSDLALGFRVDHQHDLRSKALRYHEEEEYELAITLHATIVEHWLNRMIMGAVMRRGLTEKDGQQAIRHCSTRAKTGWLWSLLFSEPLPADLVKAMDRLGAARNNYVHYKWKTVNWDVIEEAQQSLQAISASGAEIFRQLDALDDQLIFSGRRDAILRAFARMNPMDPGQADSGNPGI